MALPERKISRVASHRAPSVEARLAAVEEEAARLRAEVATLQDEIAWLTDEDAEGGHLSSGWLGRGWARASLLMAVVGLVAFVSVPYVSHLLDASSHQADSGLAAPAVTPAEAVAPEYIPAPVRVRAAEVPAPAYVPKRSPAAPRGETR
ncbi:MAG TPA: hypothetical protein VID28_10495 [Methylomirabilota bacterium]|jgi:hypothetical protein